MELISSLPTRKNRRFREQENKSATTMMGAQPLFDRLFLKEIVDGASEKSMDLSIRVTHWGCQGTLHRPRSWNPRRQQISHLPGSSQRLALGDRRFKGAARFA